MAQAQQQIELFHLLFQICLGIFLTGLTVSVLFFFLFDIRKIFNSRSGRSVKRAVQKMEETNARTGKLDVNGFNMELERSGDISSGSAEKVRTARMFRTGKSGHSENTFFQEKEANASTSVLYHDEPADTSTAVQTDESHGPFVIEKRILLVHTNEVL